MYGTVCQTVHCNENTLINTTEVSAELANDYHMIDKSCWETHGCSYEVYISNLIDELVERQNQVIASVMDDHEYSQSNILCSKQPVDTNLLHAKQRHNPQNIPLGIEGHFDPHGRRDDVYRDACIPDKVIGFLNHRPAEFSFIGPDRAPVLMDTTQKYLAIADIIRQIKVPNYSQARITLKPGLNIDK